MTVSSPSSVVLPNASAGRAEARASLLEAVQLDLASWDQVVSDFDGICQEQLAVYASRRWPGVGIEPIVFREGGEDVGGALVMLQRLPLGLATVALVKWGPILKRKQVAGAELLRRRMVETLIADYADTRGMMISIMPAVEPGEENQFAVELACRGFRSGVGVKYPMRYLVRIGLDDDERMAAFAQKWRYNLRKAFKAGLSFEHGQHSEVSRFMALYQAMSERKMFPDHSAIDTADTLMGMPEGTARPELFFVSHQGETVAGAIVFTAGDTACYLYGATSDSALDLRAGYFLHWHIIKWLGENTRVTYYDLGGTDGFAGLHQFKSGMVGEAGTIRPLPPVMNYASAPKAYLAGTAAYKAREMATRVRDAVIALRLGAVRAIKARTGKG